MRESRITIVPYAYARRGHSPAELEPKRTETVHTSLMLLNAHSADHGKSVTDVDMEPAAAVCDTDATRLRKMLEWELSLDARDLRSHAWYHGSVSRGTAEEMVAERDGDFLVRDCSSQPGNYVLTCRSKGQTLHFVINRITLQPDTVYENVQYRFEEDGFDTVPDLITYYVGSGKPITAASGAKIQTPRNRTHPLPSHAAFSRESASRRDSPNGSWRSPLPSPPITRRDSRRPSRHRLRLAAGDDAAATASDRSAFSHSLPRHSFASKMEAVVTSPAAAAATASIMCATTMPRQRKVSRDETWCPESGPSAPPPAFTATAELAPSTIEAFRMWAGGGADNDGSLFDSVVGGDAPPPPKPSRSVGRQLFFGDEPNATVEGLHAGAAATHSSYATSGSDSGNGSGDLVHSCGSGANIQGHPNRPSAPPSGRSTLRRRTSAGVVIQHPQCSGAVSVPTTPTAADKRLTDELAAAGDYTGPTRHAFTTSMPPLPSEFDVETFHTLLLPVADHKPLDEDALQAIYVLLTESGSRILANHLTRVDTRLTVASLGAEYATCMCKTGIELATLPHGCQRRSDLIERTECLKSLVAVTILACATDSDRAELLNKWIQVAIDAKTAFGNLFGFGAIMLGLCAPQVLRLDQTWHVLRQTYTDSAFNFEAKLRPTLKSMNDSTNPLAPNTTVPHLLPLALLYERGAEHIFGGGLPPAQCGTLSAMISQWESSTPDLGLGTWFTHLNSSRHFHRLLATFRHNAEIVMADSKVDDLLLDVFRTEFHLKFLWGSRGAMVAAAERHAKFEQVLDAMSEKCENDVYQPTDLLRLP